MQIHCSHDRLVPLVELVPNPRSPNSSRTPAKLSEVTGARDENEGRCLSARK